LIPLENDVAGGDSGAIEATGLHKLNITTLSIIWVGDSAIPFTNAFSKNVEIVAVKMLETKLAVMPS
jgi:hypothetical protein